MDGEEGKVKGTKGREEGESERNEGKRKGKGGIMHSCDFSLGKTLRTCFVGEASREAGSGD